MRILIGLTYYRPHYSGLTIYTERLARTLVQLGHEVTVLTSRFSKDLPTEEIRHGVRVIRPDVRLRLSKGVIMPGMPRWAWKLLHEVDVVNLHVPQMDAFYIAAFARLLKKPVALTYHCDMRLPPGFIHWLANQGSHVANEISARLANVIVTNTQDYAAESPFLCRFDGVKAIPPPIEVSPARAEDFEALKARANIQPGAPLIGMVARLATEKGVEFLIEAMPAVLEKFPNARVLFVGQYEGVLGEEAYALRLAPLIEKLGANWTFLGLLPPGELAAFFQLCAVTVLPSINVTESFGMVQVESMISGTPVVATDMRGVRQPVLSTGMGQIVQPRDANGLAAALIEVLEHPERYQKDSEEIRQRYSSETVALAYQQIFEELVHSK